MGDTVIEEAEILTPLFKALVLLGDIAVKIYNFNIVFTVRNLIIAQPY
jgi:hypothetical protein